MNRLFGRDNNDFSDEQNIDNNIINKKNSVMGKDIKTFTYKVKKGYV